MPDSFPDTYDPTMQYPGTMRPGRTPENQPYHDLPIGDDDEDPVPWPHFQQIQWHHKWHVIEDHPGTIEDFIGQQGRWVTPELEDILLKGRKREDLERSEITTVGPMILDDDAEDTEDEVGALPGGVGGVVGNGLLPGLDLVDVGTILMDSEVNIDGADSATAALPTPIGGVGVPGGDDVLMDLGLGLDFGATGGDDGDDVKEDDNTSTGMDGISDLAGLLDLATSSVPLMGDEGDDIDNISGAVEDGGESIDDLTTLDDLGLGLTTTSGGASIIEDDMIEDEVISEGVDESGGVVGEIEVVNDDKGNSKGGGRRGGPMSLDDIVGNEDMGDDEGFDDGGFDYGDSI